MSVVFKEIKVSTEKHVNLIDITQRVEEFVQANSVDAGLCIISSLHTTTAIIINEHETGLIQDVLHKVEKEFPRDAGWLHNRIDNNADAHLASIFLGGSKILPVRKGRLVRGTWQSIFLLELDGPRTRTLLLELLGK